MDQDNSERKRSELEKLLDGLHIVLPEGDSIPPDDAADNAHGNNGDHADYEALLAASLNISIRLSNGRQDVLEHIASCDGCKRAIGGAIWASFLSGLHFRISRDEPEVDIRLVRVSTGILFKSEHPDLETLCEYYLSEVFGSEYAGKFDAEGMNPDDIERLARERIDAANVADAQHDADGIEIAAIASEAQELFGDHVANAITAMVLRDCTLEEIRRAWEAFKGSRPRSRFKP